MVRESISRAQSYAEDSPVGFPNSVLNRFCLNPFCGPLGVTRGIRVTRWRAATQGAASRGRRAEGPAGRDGEGTQGARRHARHGRRRGAHGECCTRTACGVLHYKYCWLAVRLRARATTPVPTRAWAAE